MMKSVMRASLIAVLWCSVWAVAPAAETTETLSLLTFGQQGTSRTGTQLTGVKLTPGKAGGFYRPDNNVPLNSIAQLEMEFQSSEPGSVKLSAEMIKNGKRAGGTLKAIPIPADGAFHKVIFELTEMPQWKEFETLGTLEVRFVPTNPKAAPVIGFRNARFTGNPPTTAAEKAHAALATEGKMAVELLSFGNVGARVQGLEISCKIPSGKAGGAFRANDALPIGKITRLEFEFKSSIPGKIRCSVGLTDKNGKSFAAELPAELVNGAGKFEKVEFDLVNLNGFANAVSFKEIELRFVPDTPSDADVTYRNAFFTADTAKRVRAPLTTAQLTYRGEKLRYAVRMNKLDAVPGGSEDVEAFSPVFNGRGAFFQNDLSWDAAQVKQIEFSLKSDAPGYFRFGGVVQDGATRTGVKTNPFPVLPDGEYHTYILDLSANKDWKGVLTNYELVWHGEPGRLGIHAIRGVTTANRIPDAANLKPGKPQLLAKVMPRAECVFAWEGKTSPGATLRFYDRDGSELPDTAVTLPAGSKEVKFTTPEMMIEAYVTLNAAGQGFPVVQQLRYTPPGPQGNLFWRGNWIWMQNAPGPLHRRLWFQRDFELDAAPDYGCMSAVGDDDCFVYVNGHFVGKTIRWSQTDRYEITPYLRKGKNRISCRVTNIDSWGGLLADVYVSAGGKDLFFDTDANWLCESKSNTDTYIPEATDPAVVIGNSRTAPWKGGMAFRYAGPRGVLEPVKLEPGRMTVKVNRLPVEPVSTLRLVTVDENKRKIDFTLPIVPVSSEWKVGQEITITYPVPYVDHGRSEIFLEDDLVQMQGNPPIAVVDKGPAAPPALRRARWIGGGRPKFQLGDEVMQPVFCHAPATYGRDHLLWVTRCAKNNFRSYRISAYWQDYWKEDGSFDFSAFDKDVATLLTYVPDAVFAIQVYSFMPEWWLARNPDDLSRHYKAEEHPRDLWLDKQALGSEKWLTEGEIPLKALIDHIKASNYADRVWGLSFCENNCGEMFWTSADANGNRSYAGYSKSDYASFRKFLRERYADDAALAKAWGEPGVTFDTIEMPYLETARTGSVGTLLDPVKDRKMIDFFEFRSLAVAKALIHFGKFTKEQTDGKWLVGAYYGYFSEMIANPQRNIQSDGHNGFIETAQSPYVDFVHAPLRYLARKTGQPGTMMQTWDTYLLHGKMVFCEQDLRTSLTAREDGGEGKIYAGTPAVPFCDVGQFYRGFGMFAATGSLMYWYDIVSLQYDEKALNAAITEINDVYMSLGPVKGTTPFEVAIVSDRDSAYYSQFPSADNPLTIASDAVFKHFNEQAVPFKSLTISDLLDPAITVQPFKFYVMMPTLMLSRETRQKLMQRFEAEGATVLWLYTAGASYPDRGPSGENCGDFLGLQCRMDAAKAKPSMSTVPEYGSVNCVNGFETSPVFTPVAGFDAVIGKDASGTPRMVVKKIGKATHIFTSLTDLPPELYRTLLDKAGVWSYSQDAAKDQYWIGNDVLFVHAVTNGEKRFHLPAGFHARAIIGPFKGSLQSGEPFTARSGMTYGFVVERD